MLTSASTDVDERVVGDATVWLDHQTFASAAPGSPAHPLESRFALLTHRELRILVLAAEGAIDRAVLADVLGISGAAVKNALASLRRKLAVPHRMSLTDFAEQVTGLLEMVGEVEPPPVCSTERRQRDLLRVTVSELQRLEQRARRRGSALEEVAGVAADGIVAGEAQKLEAIADTLHRALQDTLAIARSTVESSDAERRRQAIAEAFAEVTTGPRVHLTDTISVPHCLIARRQLELRSES